MASSPQKNSNQNSFRPGSLAQLFGRYSRRDAASDFLPFGAQGVWQTTLAQEVRCDGIGLHSGAHTQLKITPAPADTGIVFLRTDVRSADESDTVIPALFSQVCQSTLCSMLGNAAGLQIGTVEHILAAFAGMGVDNAYVYVHGAEIPIMDGSALAFVTLIDTAGLAQLPTPRTVLRITKPVRVDNGNGSFCTLTPADTCCFETEIDFPNKAIGHSKVRLDLKDADFVRTARARTFCAMKDVEAMQAAGLALGGSLDNAIVVDEERILNEGGLRLDAEFAHHKLLDAMGDMYLLGVRIVGAYYGYKAGHALHNKLLHAVFDLGHFELVGLKPQHATPMPTAPSNIAAQ